MQFEYVYGDNVEDEHPHIYFSIERITPEIAQSMLETNIANRAFKREPIKRAILNGEWRLNGATIVFSDKGILLDGQNRLRAIVDSGIACESFVIRGLPACSQITMDVGAKRNLADYLKMDGYKEPTIVGAIGSSLHKADELGLDCHFEKHGQCDSVTLIELYEYTTSVYESRIEPIARDCAAVAKMFRLRSGLFGALFDSFRRANEEDYREFVNQIRGFSNQCQPVQKLVKTLSENASKDSKHNLSTKTIAAYIIKTWNAYMQGEEITFLRFRQGGAHPESFPEVYGLDNNNVY